MKALIVGDSVEQVCKRAGDLEMCCDISRSFVTGEIYVWVEIPEGMRLNKYFELKRSVKGAGMEERT